MDACTPHPRLCPQTCALARGAFGHEGLLSWYVLWTAAAIHYLTSVVQHCDTCRSTASPQPIHKESLSSLSRELNIVVCVINFFLDGIRIFHAMNASTRLSTGPLFENTSIATEIGALEAVYLSTFWPPVPSKQIRRSRKACSSRSSRTVRLIFILHLLDDTGRTC